MADSSEASLRAAVAARAAIAESCGATFPLSTVPYEVMQRGMRFVISVVDMAALGAKPIKVAPAAAALSSDRATGPVDAFAAVEPELFVADVGSEYMLLLNKFPVLREHAVLVCREFLPQDAALRARDVAALWTAVLDMRGLGFYNCGPKSGARTVDAGCVLTLPEFSFRHALCVLGDGILGMPTSEAGDVLLARLHAPIASAGVDLARDPGASFNVLLTPAWMLVAPRSADAWNGVFVNALGFAGYILVRPGDGAARLTEQTPLGVLEAVGVALAGRAPLGDGGSLGGAAPAT